MRTLLLCAALLALPLSAHAQGGIGASARVVRAEDVRVAEGAAAGAVRVERAAGGGLRMSVPLVMTHQARPLLMVQQRPGDPACELVAPARGASGWTTRLRCTSPAAAPEGMWARLVIVPNN